MFKEHSLMKLDFNEYQNILDLRSKKNGQKFLQSLHLIALGIVKNQMDLLGTGQWLGGILSKNKDKYIDHPNLKAVAVLKMKGLFIDHFRKSRSYFDYYRGKRRKRI